MRVVKYTFRNVGNTFSAKSISDYLKSEKRALDNETVYSYLEKLEKAYLLHRCSRYDLQGKELRKNTGERIDEIVLSFIFIILLLGVFGKLLIFGIKVSWGLAKILCTLVLLPLVLIGLVIAGFIYIAIPVLLVIGVIALFLKA